ncbi:MAG: BatD family protein [Planctomycetes bacterium]|nr:BatD family protein [Planctomycetota bacterium]
MKRIGDIAVGGWRAGVLAAGVVLVAAACPSLDADELEATLSVDPATIVVGKRAEAKVIVRTVTDVQRLAFPPVDGLIIRRGTTGQTLHSSGGRIEQYAFYVFYLIPAREGEFAVGPVSVTGASGRVYQTNSVILKAVAKADTPSDMRLEVNVAPATDVYVHQPVYLTWRLVTRRKLRSYEISAPWIHALDGFRVLDPDGLIEAWNANRRNDLTPISISGTETVARVYRKRAPDGVVEIFYELSRVYVPLAPGTCRLQAATAEAELLENDMADLFSDPLADRLLGRRTGTVYSTAAGSPVVLNVKPLPETGRPESFSGAVGAFSLEAFLTPAEVNVGETVTLTVKIAGKGSIDLAARPVMAPRDYYRSLEPEETTEGNPYGANGVVSRTFRFPLYMERPGTHEIPPLRFTFFDPSEDRYVTLASRSFSVRVAPGLPDSGLNATFLKGEPDVRPGIEDLGHDITDIFTDVGDLSDDGPLLSGRWLVLAVVVPVLLAVLAGVLLRISSARGADVVSARRRAAMANFRRGMKRKETPVLLLRRYLSDITGGRAGGEITPREAADIVHAFTVDGPADDVLGLLSGLDAARFAPGAAVDDAMRAEVVGLVERIEKCRT